MAREMKDSGIEWIGMIPRTWSRCEIKYYCKDIFPGATPQSNNPDYWDGDINWIPSGSCHDCRIYTAPKKITQAGYENSSTKLIPANTALVAMTGATCGNTGYLTIESCANQSVTAFIEDKTRCDSVFLWYVLRAAKEHLLTFQSGGAQGGVNVENCKSIVVPFVPLEEQRQIAEFLDRKCAEIDSVIADTQRTIEEYKKLKQSVITQAVTKGIRGERPMKDSGIQGIGDIPEGWRYSPIKYVASFQPSCETSALSEDSEITYTPMDCIKNGYYIQNTAKYGAVTSSLTPYEEGDIVMAKVTPCFENGNIAIMENLASGFGMGSSELFVYRATGVNKRFLLYWLQNDKFKDYACATMTGTGGLKRVSPYYAKNAMMLLPPDEEEAEIVAFLDGKCAEVDRLIEAKELLLAELESYKKSVIYEYVTGKKEVPACQ